MDAPTALFYSAILSALITGIFLILGEFVKARLQRDLDKEKEEKEEEKGGTKGKPRKKKKPTRKKFSDLPIFTRAAIIFLVIAASSFIFFYHTGIFPKPTEGVTAVACPNRQNFPESEKLAEQEVWVRNGYVAYYAGWLFDGKDGGYFITFKGPYKALHTFGNGVYCPPVPMNTELARSTEELLMKECEASEGGCSKPKTCTQSIFGYHLTKGVCNE